MGTYANIQESFCSCLMSDTPPVHTMQVPVTKVAWWKLAFNLVNIVIAFVLAFSALFAFVQGYAQNLQVDPPDVKLLLALNVGEIQSSSKSTNVGDQKFFASCYYVAGALNILTMFRVLFMNAKVVNNLSNKKKEKRNLGDTITEKISRNSIIGINSTIGKKFLKVDSMLKHFDFDGKYFWYKFLASGMVGVLLQFLRFLTFAGLDILGSPTYVEVKKPFAVISYAFVLSVHLVFGVAMFSSNKKLPAVIFVIILDFYYALVPLLNVHGSIFDPSQWYPIRNLNGLEVLAGVVPLILKCGTLQYVSIRNMKRITNQDNLVVADNIHRRSTKLGFGVFSTGLAVSLLLFTLVKHFGADCKSTEEVAECIRWSHPIFDDVSCDCVMLSLYLPKDTKSNREGAIQLLEEVGRFSRVQYLLIYNRINVVEDRSGEEYFERMRTRFVLLEAVAYSTGKSERLDFYGMDKLSVYISEFQEYGEDFDWSLLQTVPNLKHANFSFSKIPHWPDVDDVKHIETLLLYDNPVCYQEIPAELQALGNLQCFLETDFGLDEKCKEIFGSATVIADFRERCDKRLESGLPTACIETCASIELYFTVFNNVIGLDYDLDGYFSAKEIRTVFQGKTNAFSEKLVNEESLTCLNKNNKGCPHDGEQHLLPFTSIAVYGTTGGSNCIECPWAQKRLQALKEGPKVLEPDSELTASKPGDVDPEDCARLLSQDVYQEIIESCNRHHANGKPQECTQSCLLVNVISSYPLIDDDGDGVINSKELGAFLKAQDLLSKAPTDATMICLAEKVTECPASREGPFVSFDLLLVFTHKGESGCKECEAYPEYLKS